MKCLRLIDIVYRNCQISFMLGSFIPEVFCRERVSIYFLLFFDAQSNNSLNERKICSKVVLCLNVSISIRKLQYNCIETFFQFFQKKIQNKRFQQRGG